jgi:hypothetical protein
MAPMRRTRRREESYARRGGSHARAADEALAKLRKLLDLAEADPDRFIAECRSVASKLGVGVEQVYRLLQDDPRTRDFLKKAALQGAAKLARRALGML